MAQTNLSFSATIDKWVAETKQRAEAVFREASQRTVSIAQSNVPVDTGFLRASIRASLESLPPIQAGSRPGKGSSHSFTGGDIVTTIAHATLGQTIFVGYTASYAGYVEYGTSRTPPRAFVGLAAEQWPATVSRVVSELKGRAGQ